jgi:hypothetical protein
MAPDERRLFAARAGRAAITSAAIFAVLASGVVVCPVAIVARQPCPACGLTRASLSLFQFDVPGAFALHPMVFVVLPLLALWALAAAHAYITTGRPSPSPRLGRAFGYAFPIVLALMLALYVARFFGAFGGPVPV